MTMYNVTVLPLLQPACFVGGNLRGHFKSAYMKIFEDNETQKISLSTHKGRGQGQENEKAGDELAKFDVKESYWEQGEAGPGKQAKYQWRKMLE